AESLGIRILCGNVKHPYHESKFEALTCKILHKYYPAEKLIQVISTLIEKLRNSRTKIRIQDLR
ncbi:MAG: hypothetical protein ACW981_21485, partial [Candidatus Hodarchaeales archaeon]